MKPITFKEKNRTLLKPKGMTDAECSSLDVYTDGNQCISCWRPSFRERLSMLFFGRCWLFIHSGITQPPIAALGARTCFEYSPEPSDPSWLVRLLLNPLRKLILSGGTSWKRDK